MTAYTIFKRCTAVLALFLFSGGLAQAKEKYAIGLFHFNFQYVAGDYKIERRIIRESLLPVLQFFDAHPSYKSDIEMQGYAIGVLAEEHPDVLSLLRKLVKRGQIELVVAHYSDQLWIGYPAEDMRRSIELSDELLAKNGLQRSRVFFGQEFQWSPGLASALKGKYDIVATSSDPNNWYIGETLPLVNVRYGSDSILALVGSGRKQLEGMEWGIAFLDDGEEFNTLDYNSDFYRVPKQEKENMDKYKKMQEEGYHFCTITELASRIKADVGYSTPVYPFVPEGTWHMKVCGPFMWMGRQRSGVETDGITRALSYQARGELLMAEKLLDAAAAQGKDVSALRAILKEAWKHLLLSEVSDSSGWDPWLVEVQYTENEVTTTRKLLAGLLEGLWKLMAGVNGGAGSVATGGGGGSFAGLDGVCRESAVLPVGFSVLAASYHVSIAAAGDSLYRMDVECQRPADGGVEIAFDCAEMGLQYSAACGESTKVVIPSVYRNDPAFALSNGFIYLNNGYSVVKDCSVEHLAATWRRASRRVVFREELRTGNETMHMRFYLVKGSAEKGMAFANALNVWPSYLIDNNTKGYTYKRVTP